MTWQKKKRCVRMSELAAYSAHGKAPLIGLIGYAFSHIFLEFPRHLVTTLMMALSGARRRNEACR